jgi:Uncharacterised protein family (UPF0158)
MTENSSPNRLSIDAIDMDQLSSALSDGNPANSWYFDTNTGDVRPAGDWTTGYEPAELEEQGWIWIEPTGSRVGFADMETFAGAVGDLRARDVLVRSLEGKGAFRRFRDTLREHQDLRNIWHSWTDAQQGARAARWLLDHDVLDELEADAAATAYRASAQEALDRARATGGEGIDMDAAPAQWASIMQRIGRGEAVVLLRNGRPAASITPFEAVR